MMDSVILWSIIILGALGAIFGIGLAISSYIFAVKIDPKVEEVYDVLPDLNCGSCGYAGCLKYAEAVVKNNETTTLCAPGGEEAASKIAHIMGLDVSSEGSVKKVAFVFCCGGQNAKKNSDYQGIPDCNAASLVGQGPLKCDYGCMMFHSCYKACKFGAIEITPEGLPKVIKDKCVGCMACVKACPKSIIKMVPATGSVFVMCNSKDRGKEVMDACSKGCIGCSKCVKTCPSEAITMLEGLAVIDHLKCTVCLQCVEVCPVKVIHNIN